MAKLFIFLAFLSVSLWSAELHLNVQNVSEDGKSARIQTARVEPGVSGFVVRHFTKEHSSIVAAAVVTAYDDASGTLDVAFSPYMALRQNSLPKGLWTPEAGDELVLAYAYGRGVMISPTEKVYRKLTERITTVDWMHPDTLATYLSYQGHPTPLKKDLAGFCDVATTGLLFIYLDDSLLTVDCQSLGVLQITKADLPPYEKPQLPFYSRVEKIEANWFGEGSGRLESYEPYYLELLVENNPHSQKLYDFIQSQPSADKQLLDEFDLKGQL